MKAIWIKKYGCQQLVIINARFGQVLKLSHIYTPDFSSGKSATHLNAQVITNTVRLSNNLPIFFK